MLETAYHLEAVKMLTKSSPQGHGAGEGGYECMKTLFWQ